MNVHPYFPEKYSHILRHMVQTFRDCDCAIIHYPNGEIKRRNPNTAGDPNIRSHQNTLRAMEAAGLIIKSREVETNNITYYPTISGLHYLASHDRPIRTWLKSNWFAVTVLLVTTSVSVVAFFLR